MKERIMQEELISVIIPIYNVENYLKKCLDSICSNTYHNLEIILVDDGSKDQSGKICDEYCKYDKRCRVYHRKNHGVSATRNFGLQCATGKYVAFIDSDDYIEKNYFSSLSKTIEASNSELAVCRICHRNKDGKVIQII